MKGNGFFWRVRAGKPKPSVCRTWLGAVCGMAGSKPKIGNRFPKPNSEPGPNNQLSDSLHKLVIRHPHVRTC